MEALGDNLIGGRYRLGESRTSSRLGQTWFGRDQRGNDVVVALVRPDDPERFLGDMAEAATIRHPNLAPVVDYGAEGRDFFIVTERVDGTDLAVLMASPDPLPPETVAQIGEAAAAGLSALHGSGLVHGRVQPKHVVKTEDGVCLVGAVYSGALPTWRTLFTEPASDAHFLSPEQARGLEPEPASDIYSLGATLYQLTTGRPPFEGSTAGEVATAHLSAHVVPPRLLNRDIPLALEGVILKALAKDPGRRFRSAEDMRRALWDVLRPQAEGDSQTEARSVRATRLRRPRLVPAERTAWWRRSALWPAMLIVVAAALGILTALWATGALSGGTMVPDLRGMTLAQAEDVLEATGFTVGSVTSDTGVDPDGPNAWVIGQTPDGGDDAEQGGAVDLRLGATHPTAPDVTGLSQAEAAARLTAAGFRLGDVTKVRRPGALNGAVVAQEPAAGDPLERGGAVDIMVASSSASGVPDVVGYLQADAVKALRRAGYTAVVQRAANSAPKGTVISQYPEPGQRPKHGSPVTIVVSEGEAPSSGAGEGTI